MTLHEFPDEVVLVDDLARPVGTRGRGQVHGRDTAMHLAFSCYLFDRRGRLLLTRRALVKRTWPGVWTNSFCGHPRPGEPLLAAVDRHADHELGTTVVNSQVVLPDFRYRAVDASGVVENEICPVLVAVAGGPLRPNPEEVAEHRWVEPEELGRLVAVAPWTLTPWLVAQVHALVELEEAPAEALGARELAG